MASIFDILSSVLVLAIFLGIVYGGILLSRSISTATTQKTTQLRSQGININQGRLSVTTDKVAPSRQEYIAQTQRAFEQGAKTMALHPEAFKMGNSNREPSPLDGAVATGTSSSVDNGAKKGFHRTKKLA